MPEPHLSPWQRFLVRNHNARWLMGAVSLLCPRRTHEGFMALTAREPLGWLEKKAALTLSFDCDFSKDVEAFPFVLDLLRPRGIRASFAVVGIWLERYPDLHRRLVDEGHEIINHTWSHPDNEEINPGRKFRLISRAEKKEEVERAHEIIHRLLGIECRGFRIPHFRDLFTDEIYGILSELGYRFDSSTLMTGVESGGRPFRAAEGIWEFPLTTCPLHPLTVLDTWHSLHVSHPVYRLSHSTPEQFCDLLGDSATSALKHGNWVNIYLDPWDLPALTTLPSLLDSMIDDDDLEILAYDDILSRLEGGS